MFLLSLMRHPEPDPQLLQILWGERRICVPCVPPEVTPSPNHSIILCISLCLMHRELQNLLLVVVKASPCQFWSPKAAKWGFLCPQLPQGGDFGWEIRNPGSKMECLLPTNILQSGTPLKSWEKELLSWIMRVQREMVKGPRGAGGQQEQETILDNTAALDEFFIRLGPSKILCSFRLIFFHLNWLISCSNPTFPFGLAL